jgi:hypothetical protein
MQTPEIYILLCRVEVKVLFVIPEVCFPFWSSQQPVSLCERTRVDWLTSLLADTRILEEGIVGSAAASTAWFLRQFSPPL